MSKLWNVFLNFWDKYQDLFDWIPEVSITLFFTLCTYLVYQLVTKKLEVRFSAERNIYGNAIVYALRRPGAYFICLIGLIFSEILIRETFEEQEIFFCVEYVRLIAIILLLTWCIMRFIRKGEQHFINSSGNKKKPLNYTTVLAIGRLLRTFVVITTVLSIMGSLRIDITGIVAFGSAGTIVAGIAAKELLANFFGGFMIFMDRPFSVGDWIRSPDKSIEGIVEHIGWRVTLIRTFNKRPLYVPNAVFLSISIENPSRMSNRQIKDIVGLRYCDAGNLLEIISKIEEMLKKHPDLDHRQTIAVAFNKFGHSSLDCLIYCFTKTTQWVPYLKIQQDIFVKITEIVHQYGGDVAFPTTTIVLPEDALSMLGRQE